MFRLLVKSVLFGSLAVGTLWATVGPERVEHWVKDGKKAVEEKFKEYQGMGAELRSIQGSVERLTGEIESLKETAIRTEIEVNNLEQEIAGKQTAVDHLRTNLEKAHCILEQDHAAFIIAGCNYSRDEIERDVQDKINLFRLQQDTLSQLNETLQTQRNALMMAKENISRGETVRADLVSRLRLLQAKLQRYRAREIYAEAVATDFDTQEFNTQIGEARKLLAQFEDKLTVKNRLLDERMKIDPKSHVSGIDYAAKERLPLDLKAELESLLAGSENDVSTSTSLSVRR